MGRRFSLFLACLLLSVVVTPATAQTAAETRARLKAMYDPAAADIAAGRYDSAQTRLRAAMAVAEPALGPDDPQTLELRNDLALAAYGLGQAELAERMLNQIVETQRRVQGPKHPDTLLAIDNQAAVLAALGRTAQAAALYREAWSGRIATLGQAHRKTLESGLSLAVCLCELSRCDESALIERQLLEVAIKADGDKAPMAILAATRLSVSLWRQGFYDEGDDLILRTAKLSSGALAKDDPIALEVAAAVAEGLRRLGSEDSLALLQRIETREKSVNPLGDARTLFAMYGVAAALIEMGRTQEGKHKLQEIQNAIARQTRADGSALSIAITTQVALGAAEDRLGQPRAAYEAYTRACDLVLQRYGDRRASGGGEAAMKGMVAARDVFLRRISGGWALAHGRTG